jgi:hypothetical protein
MLSIKVMFERNPSAIKHFDSSMLNKVQILGNLTNLINHIVLVKLYLSHLLYHGFDKFIVRAISKELHGVYQAGIAVIEDFISQE